MKQNDKIHECVILYEIYIVRILKKKSTFFRTCVVHNICAPTTFKLFKLKLEKNYLVTTAGHMI